MRGIKGAAEHHHLIFLNQELHHVLHERSSSSPSGSALGPDPHGRRNAPRNVPEVLLSTQNAPPPVRKYFPRRHAGGGRTFTIFPRRNSRPLLNSEAPAGRRCGPGGNERIEEKKHD